ncbi:hypothetical protein [Tissierella sp.]|uniref:hypothetical protein n=1 Tax=Tissierella sp. TaxID=41274 RepID=UPI003027BCA9
MKLKNKYEDYFDLEYINDVANLYHNNNPMEEMVTHVSIDVPPRGRPILKIESLSLRDGRQSKQTKEMEITELKASIKY